MLESIRAVENLVNESHKENWKIFLANWAHNDWFVAESHKENWKYLKFPRKIVLVSPRISQRELKVNIYSNIECRMCYIESHKENWKYFFFCYHSTASSAWISQRELKDVYTFTTSLPVSAVTNLTKRIESKGYRALIIEGTGDRISQRELKEFNTAWEKVALLTWISQRELKVLSFSPFWLLSIS